MNTLEAKTLLAQELEPWRCKTFAELADLVGETRAYEKIISNGMGYQIEINVFWDNQPGGDIRVLGSIDDGGWRAFVPLTNDFLKSRTIEI